MEKVTAKLVCNYVQEQQDGGKVLHFHAVYDDGGNENKSFATATPGAYLNMTVNPGTPVAEEGFFKQGQAYYLDFTPVPST